MFNWDLPTLEIFKDIATIYAVFITLYLTLYKLIRERPFSVKMQIELKSQLVKKDKNTNLFILEILLF